MKPRVFYPIQYLTKRSFPIFLYHYSSRTLFYGKQFSLSFFSLVGQEPEIPDLIDYMQSGDDVKVINAARYLQHLCFSKESVKDKVR